MRLWEPVRSDPPNVTVGPAPPEPVPAKDFPTMLVEDDQLEVAAAEPTDRAQGENEEAVVNPAPSSVTEKAPVDGPFVSAVEEAKKAEKVKALVCELPTSAFTERTKEGTTEKPEECLQITFDDETQVVASTEELNFERGEKFRQATAALPMTVTLRDPVTTEFMTTIAETSLVSKVAEAVRDPAFAALRTVTTKVNFLPPDAGALQIIVECDRQKIPSKAEPFPMLAELENEPETPNPEPIMLTLMLAVGTPFDRMTELRAGRLKLRAKVCVPMWASAPLTVTVAPSRDLTPLEAFTLVAEVETQRVAEAAENPILQRAVESTPQSTRLAPTRVKVE